MNEIIEFPNNAENYYRKALNALKARHFEQAELLLLKSLQLEFHPDAFFELVHLYLALHRKESLRDLWDSYYPGNQAHLENETLALYYALSVTIMYPLTKALVELYRLRDYFQQQGWDTPSIQVEIDRLNQHQSLADELAQAIANEQVAIFLEELYATGAYNVLELLKYLYTLPYENCAPLYRLILQHPHIEQYIKSDVLHYFINQKIDETLPLIWFGEPHTVLTGSLRPYNAQTQFLASVTAIQTYCEQQNPHLYEELIQQLTLQSMCFYPFINEVLQQPNDWLTYMVDQDTPNSPLAEKITQASYELFRLLEQETLE